MGPLKDFRYSGRLAGRIAGRLTGLPGKPACTTAGRLTSFTIPFITLASQDFR